MQSGSAMIGYGIGQVLASKSSGFHPGDVVLVQQLNWSTHVIKHERQCEPISNAFHTDIKLSYYLGALGLIGATAYYGLLDIGELKAGQNVFITGAAGATGSIAAQIAKHVKHCHVVGSAGSSEKCKWLKEELGLDDVVNYKEYQQNVELIQKDLAQRFPNGIDVYFDNTGGFQTEAVWKLLNNKARVVLCGQISQYNNSHEMGKLDKIDNFLLHCILMNIRVEGFLLTEFQRWSDFYVDMAKWIKDGKVKCKETFVEGIEKVPDALKGLFTGRNTGKMIVKISELDESLMSGRRYNAKRGDMNVQRYPDLGRLLNVWREEAQDKYFGTEKPKSKL